MLCEISVAADMFTTARSLVATLFFSPFCVFVCVVTRSPHFGNMLVSFFFFDVLFFSLFFTTLFSPFFLYCLCVHVCVCVCCVVLERFG